MRCSRVAGVSSFGEAGKRVLFNYCGAQKCSLYVLLKFKYKIENALLTGLWKDFKIERLYLKS